MVIPSRWFAGGKGLDEFRKEMLNDNHIRKIVDYSDSTECFPGVDISWWGVLLFTRTRKTGPCEITNYHAGEEFVSTRQLNEFSTIVRHGKAISIVNKVVAFHEETMNKQVSSRKPFGLATNVSTIE